MVGRTQNGKTQHAGMQNNVSKPRATPVANQKTKRRPKRKQEGKRKHDPKPAAAAAAAAAIPPPVPPKPRVWPTPAASPAHDPRPTSTVPIANGNKKPSRNAVLVRSNTAPPQAPSANSYAGNHNANRAFNHAPKEIKRKAVTPRPHPAASAQGPKIATTTPRRAAPVDEIYWEGHPGDYEKHLPGYQCIAYDAARNLYTFEDYEGRRWKGEPNNYLKPAECYESDLRRNMPSGTANVKRNKTAPAATGHRFDNFGSLKTEAKSGKEQVMVLSDHLSYPEFIKASAKAEEERRKAANDKAQEKDEARKKKRLMEDEAREKRRLMKQDQTEKKRAAKAHEKWSNKELKRLGKKGFSLCG